MTAENKRKCLDILLQELGNVAVAFSGGVDSTFLLHAAQEVPGVQAVALTVDTGFNSRAETAAAEQIARSLGAEHYVLRDRSLLEREDFLDNPPGRCYTCKKEIMARLKEKAAGLGSYTLVDGSNAGDLDDYRPGMRALQELGITSPLQAAGLVKEEIRELARREGLPVWDKPSSPCLCSRIPYGSRITPEKLQQIEKGEHILRTMGFAEVRLRHHGDLARIEVPLPRMGELLEEGVLAAVRDELKGLGFNYVALDLDGFRSGSLNEALG